MRIRMLAGLGAGALVMGAGLLCASDKDYQTSIEQWRQDRETKLKADDGWLTVAGLFWLREGANNAGSAASNAIRLPRGPAHIGDFVFHAGRTTFRKDAGVQATVTGDGASLRSDTDKGGPDQVSIGDFNLFVIHRGDRYGIRLKDRASEYRRAFTGLHWYPIRESYRVTARFVSYSEPRSIAVPNILGMVEQEPSPAYAVFQLEGREYRLDPVLEGDQLFFIFRDQTSGKQTYPSGRFLYAELPKSGKVMLDFNKAYNPPCAFTPYATCPLPPRQNRLAIAVDAGELNYGHH